MSPRDAVIARMRDWLFSKDPTLRGHGIGDEEDLIDTGILSSLELVEFILFLEQEHKARILVEALDPDSIRTLDRIYRCFFAT